jgi:hypothetical protein
VNGRLHEVSGSRDTPLLYVLRDELHLIGPRFGCGLAQCGACSVLLDGRELARSPPRKISVVRAPGRIALDRCSRDFARSLGRPTYGGV